MKVNHRRRASAFTLVEVLVALGILGIVLAAIYSTWTAILRSSKVGQEAAAQVQRERMAIRTIEEALISARSFAVDLPHYGFVAENGDEATLSFVSRLPKAFPRAGRFGDLDVRRVTFSLDSRPNYERDLVLRQNPILMDLTTDEKEHPVVLARNVKDLELKFWDPRSGDFIDEWKQTNQLPRLVMITLRLGGGDPRGPGVQTEITRLVALPSIMVPPNWQAPALPAMPPPPPPQPTPVPRGGGPG